MSDYFSDQELGPRARTAEVINPTVWGGIVGLVQSLISNGAFGLRYPELCPDGNGPIGTDENALSLAVKAEIPGLIWPLDTTKNVQIGFYSELQPYAPETMQVLDFIQFCYRVVAKPIQTSHHRFFDHYHLQFDEVEGREGFMRDVNRIFMRNGLAYELRDGGEIVRLAPLVLRDALGSARFNSGDLKLDSMLEESRAKFLSPSEVVRREAVERLWDCWERLKTLDNPNNKKQSIESMIFSVSSDEKFRDVLGVEARSLTDIGNSFHIRHSEMNQSVLTDSRVFDYLFHRLFSLIQLLLSARA